MGRADYLALGDWNVVCYECGHKFKASMMKRHWQGYWVCPAHWEPRQPQDFVRSVPDNMTPPWVQPMPADTFTFGDLLITESSSLTENFDYISTETFYPLTTET